MKLPNSALCGIILGFSILFTYLLLHFYYDLFNLPYFWDELGVYSRAALHMYGHGIGLLPASLPDELSRGHPVIIPFIFGAGFKIFGCNFFVAKIIAAAIYSIGILYLYRIFLLTFLPKYAFIFSYLVFIQPCFLSQSVLVLPEIPLMTATIITLFYYLKGNYLFASIALVIAMFVKESAIILPLALYLTDFIINRFNLKNFIFLILLPFLFIILYFTVQFYQRGYVFYPLHTSLVKLEMYFINERYRDFSKFAFWGQGRDFLWFYLPALFIILKMVKSDKIIFSKIHINLKCFNFKIYLTMLLLFAAGLSFSVLNYYLSRYSLYFLIFIYIAFFTIFFRGIKWHYLHYASVLIIIINAVIYNNDSAYTDVNFSYVNHIKSCVKAINYLNVPENADKTVAMDFPISVATWDTHSGYFDTLYFKPRLRIRKYEWIFKYF